MSITNSSSGESQTAKTENVIEGAKSGVTSEPQPEAIQRGPASLLADLFALSHIFNGVASAAAVAIGYLAMVWFYKVPINGAVLLAVSLATLFLSNAGFIVNDIFDLAIDRINRPDRPLAAGYIPVTVAWIMYTLYNLAGIVLAFTINPVNGVIASLIALGLFLYSYDFKKRFVIGHTTIGLFGALLMPFGGIAAGRGMLLWTIPVTFLAFFAREALKTVPDAEGDKANGVDNITIRYGERVAVRISQWMFALCAVSLPLLRLLWQLNNWFLIIVAVIIWPLTIFFLVLLSRQLTLDQPKMPLSTINDSAMRHSNQQENLYYNLNPTSTYKNVNTVLRISKLLFLLVAVAILMGSLP